LIPEHRFPIPFHPFKELECYHYYDGPICALVEDGRQKYISIYWNENREDQTQTFVYFPTDEVTTDALVNNKITLLEFELSVPYIIVIREYVKDIYPSACWKVSPLLVDPKEFASPGVYMFLEPPAEEKQ
jgi:hypothetical protein